ncbi:unnamed protein product [Boreogadus saida]
MSLGREDIGPIEDEDKQGDREGHRPLTTNQLVNPQPSTNQLVNPQPSTNQLVNPQPSTNQLVNPQPSTNQLVNPQPSTNQLVNPQPWSPPQPSTNQLVNPQPWSLPQPSTNQLPRYVYREARLLQSYHHSFTHSPRGLREVGFTRLFSSPRKNRFSHPTWASQSASPWIRAAKPNTGAAPPRWAAGNANEPAAP